MLKTKKCGKYLDLSEVMNVIEGSSKLCIWRVHNFYSSQNNDNIKVDLKETGHEDVGWIHVSQDETQQQVQ
jgi:hypothetical protein